MRYHNPKNEAPIDALYAVLSRDADGCEGVCSFMIPPYGAVPLVFGDRKMIDFIYDQLKQMSKDNGKTLVICKFTDKEILEVISKSH